ncbi:hypothetical protein Poli38472_009748 [Pythium oligandrum]|uniref:AAA+ ATPase domain-containing protein n=1 Tax=Pythium oligandrum TaxID=41045 RepID=A0A8K1CGE4_PYTOL|nr:hypothetical protein Poli38472_009748 [Pythium oligandrum]|eukprot:TMW62255.1 hypothetical protein Poli38472_009748 [Pythium oligandrum]
MATAYEWLLLYGDRSKPETQQDILRHLECVDVPASQRESVRALERTHFEAFLRARRQQRQESVERISERRSQLRAQARERWQGASTGVSVEEIQGKFPGLFKQHQKAPTVQPPPAVVERSPTPEPVMTKPAAIHRPPPVTMNEPPRFNHVQQNAAPPPPAVSGPQRALSEMLRRKSAAVDEDDDDEVYSYPPTNRNQPSRPPPSGRNPFQTAGAKLQHDRLTGKNHMDDEDEYGGRNQRGGRGLSRQTPRTGGSYHPVNPHLLLGGGSRDEDDEFDDNGAIRKKFVSPVIKPGEDRPGKNSSNSKPAAPPEEDENIDPRLKSCDPELIAKIEMEIVDYGDPITFDDIAGLQFAKKCVNELVIWPMARPDIFTGLRSLPKGLLLFGPPGTGKTLIGKAIANQSGATFFSISASSLTSKWIGEGEKLVRTLFAVAAVKQPSVIFIDEIDSLLTQRSSEENEASRRMKTEFLVQLDGAGTKAKDVILVVGATNRPQELDEAARRRFVKRLYIPLPSFEARLDLVCRLLKDNRHDLTDEEKKLIAEKTKGYSGADVRALCTEAAMGPIRSCSDIRTMDADSVRPISLEDFNAALRGVRSSVAAKDLDFYREWNDEFGSFAFEGHED